MFMLQKVKKIKLFILGLLVIIVLSFTLPNYFFPGDVLNNLTTFSLNGWEKPKNSLLADPVFQFEPWRHYAKERLHKGEFPLWNDKNGNGVPFFANPQTAVLYPLNIFYYLFPDRNALYLIPLLKLYLFGVFSFLYFRSLKCSLPASLVGACSSIFLGFTVVWLLWPHTNVFLLFPLILFLTEKIYGSAKNLHRYYILLSLAYFTAILGGHPETLMHLGFVHLGYILIRFWSEKKRTVPIITSIFFGFVLGAIQLLPFLEYLSNSFVWQKRSLVQPDFFLPLKSFVLNIFPFLFGAPHLQFYKPISTFTNFQEDVGGYAGLIIFSMSVIGSIIFRKDKMMCLWTIIVGLSFLIAYKIWPFYFISYLPILRNSANHRLVGFAGFGLVVLFTLTINKIKISPPKFLIKNSNILIKKLLILLLLLILSIFLTPTFFKGYAPKLLTFIDFLKIHIALIISTTIIFYIVLLKILKEKNFNFKYYFIISFLIFAQSGFLLWNYNPIISSAKYYPETDLIKTLRNLPEGNIMQVGNPSIPPNINLMYGLSSVKDDDVMEIANYRNSYDNVFSVKNQWDVVDSVTVEKVKNFNTKYIISDYDLNLDRKVYQKDKNTLLNPILKPFEIPFIAKGDSLKQLRVMSANFNRKNTCRIIVSILDKSINSVISKSNASCTDFRDFTFYTIQFGEVQLIKNKEYTARFTPVNVSENNNIALWGNSKKIPYIEFFYESKNREKQFNLIWNKKNVYLWQVSGESLPYLIISSKPEDLVFEVNSKKDDWMRIMKVYYPGWAAYVNGEKEAIKNGNPFILVKVPKGQSLVEIKYEPLSFYLGLFISIIGIISITLYFIEKERRLSWVKDFQKKWEIWANKVGKNTKWWEHGIVFLIGFTFATSLSILIIKIMAIKFSAPKGTMAVTWFSIHNYPKQQDYFYFYFCFILILISTLLIWFIWIWLKNKKY